MQFSGEPERAGRWAGKSKWECGIHGGEAAKQDPVRLAEPGVIRLDEP